MIFFLLRWKRILLLLWNFQQTNSTDAKERRKRIKKKEKIDQSQQNKFFVIIIVVIRFCFKKKKKTFFKFENLSKIFNKNKKIQIMNSECVYWTMNEWLFHRYQSIQNVWVLFLCVCKCVKTNHFVMCVYGWWKPNWEKETAIINGANINNSSQY